MVAPSNICEFYEVCYMGLSKAGCMLKNSVTLTCRKNISNVCESSIQAICISIKHIQSSGKWKQNSEYGKYFYGKDTLKIKGKENTTNKMAMRRETFDIVKEKVKLIKHRV